MAPHVLNQRLEQQRVGKTFYLRKTAINNEYEEIQGAGEGEREEVRSNKSVKKPKNGRRK